MQSRVIHREHDVRLIGHQGAHIFVYTPRAIIAIAQMSQRPEGRQRILPTGADKIHYVSRLAAIIATVVREFTVLFEHLEHIVEVRVHQLVVRLESNDKYLGFHRF